MNAIKGSRVEMVGLVNDALYGVVLYEIDAKYIKVQWADREDPVIARRTSARVMG